ncbi:MAG: hypothetical protein AAFR70_13900, partial [Pseudomonadota bacterium]
PFHSTRSGDEDKSPERFISGAGATRSIKAWVRLWRSMPPGHSSGFVTIWRPPHLLQVMRLPTVGTGCPPGNGKVAGSMSRSRPHEVQ